MRGVRKIVLLAGFLALVSGASYAQMSAFGPWGLPLTSHDLKEMGKAVQPLLTDDSIPIGTTNQWSNSASGNHGSVQLLERFETQYEGNNLPCRKIRYHIEVKGNADPYNVVLDRCKVADGSWKIL